MLLDIVITGIKVKIVRQGWVEDYDPYCEPFVDTKNI